MEQFKFSALFNFLHQLISNCTVIKELMKGILSVPIIINILGNPDHLIKIHIHLSVHISAMLEVKF